MYLCAADATRDATLSSNGVIRFVELKLHHVADACNSSRDDMVVGWTATVWKRMLSSNDWVMRFESDIADILAKLSSVDLPHKFWDDKSNKLDLSKVSSAPPTLSLTNEDVVYFMANFVTDEALVLSVNITEERLEAVEKTSYEMPCSPCSFTAIDASPG